MKDTHTCTNTDTNAHPDNALRDTDTNTDTCSHLPAHAHALTQICIHTEIHTFLHTQACIDTWMHSYLHTQACITHRHIHACIQRLDLSSGFWLFRVIVLTPFEREWINFSSPFMADFSFLASPYFYFLFSFLLFLNLHGGMCPFVDKPW